MSLNHFYEAPELLYSLNKVKMSCIVIAGELKGKSYYETLRKAVPDVEFLTECEPSDGGQKVRSRIVPSLTSIVSMEDQPPAKSLFFPITIEFVGISITIC